MLDHRLIDPSEIRQPDEQLSRVDQPLALVPDHRRAETGDERGRRALLCLDKGEPSPEPGVNSKIARHLVDPFV